MGEQKTEFCTHTDCTQQKARELCPETCNSKLFNMIPLNVKECQNITRKCMTVIFFSPKFQFLHFSTLLRETAQQVMYWHGKY